MELKDNIAKEYMKDNRCISDLFNCSMYEGSDLNQGNIAVWIDEIVPCLKDNK